MRQHGACKGSVDVMHHRASIINQAYRSLVTEGQALTARALCEGAAALHLIPSFEAMALLPGTAQLIGTLASTGALGESSYAKDD
jgi:hypothetical protein